MAEDKREAERQGGEYMIQDRDHMTETGQMGGKASHGGRQSDQSHSAKGQEGGQQGGERSRRRSKLL